MENINEALLSTWLRLSTSVVNSRIVSEMSFNESLVCNILYRNLKENPEKGIIATELCNKTNILKSQMNRILNQLEKKNIIVRERSKEDKRQVYVKMNLSHADVYRKQHERILKIVDEIIYQIGEEKAIETISTLAKISDVADNLLEKNKEK